MKKYIKKAIKLVVGGFFLACFVIIVIQRLKDEIPTLFNHSVFIILTDSMTPDYEVDDVILVKHVKASDVHEGDVITYQGMVDSYAGKVITHKVVQEPQLDSNGVYHIQTQGIKIGAPLDPEITEDQLIGVVVTKLPVITFFYKVVTSLYGFVFVIVVPMVAILVLQLIQLKKNSEKEEVKHAKEEVKK